MTQRAPTVELDVVKKAAIGYGTSCAEPPIERYHGTQNHLLNGKRYAEPPTDGYTMHRATSVTVRCIQSHVRYGTLYTEPLTVWYALYRVLLPYCARAPSRAAPRIAAPRLVAPRLASTRCAAPRSAAPRIAAPPLRRTTSTVVVSLRINCPIRSLLGSSPYGATCRIAAGSCARCIG